MASEDGNEASPASSIEFFPSSDSERDMADALGPGASTANPSKRKLNDAPPYSPGKRRRFSSAAAVAAAPPSSRSSQSSSSLPSCKGLSPEIWQAIFLHLSPHDLGRLLRVNRAFLLYLTTVIRLPEGRRSSGSILPLRTSDSIWSRSRKMYNPGFPRPLRGLSERDMWALVGSHASRRTCQFCQSTAEQPALATTSVWEQGPGAHGVRIVWPFGIRTCGACLKQRCQNDMALLLSSASALKNGLPFIFLTDDLHVIYPSTLTQQSNIPSNIALTKYYCTTQVDAIQKEFEEARALGAAAAEEWFKGLDARRQQLVSDAERCERWEAREQAAAATNTSTPSATPSTHTPSKPNAQSRSSTQHSGMSTCHAPSNSNGLPRSYSPQVSSSALPGSQGHNVQASSTQPRAERTIREVNDAKASRKAEIERRSQALDPPIPPKVLRHMDSFKAALMIPAALTEQAWELLAPRLIAQREAAEEIERQQAAHLAALPAKSTDSKAKDAMDREWEESQRPIRDRLSQYADEIIHDEWRDGNLVNKEQVSKFAAAVLLHVRKRYYDEHGAEKNHDETAREDKEQSPLPSKLVLENMKWVFDNKIKHITERYRKEIFLCSACGGNYKFYGFEGVIQHYGAKHTNLFTVGNVIVSWKEAEWPEDPPFIPDPFAPRNAFLATSGPGQGPSGFSSYGYGSYSRANTTTPGMSGSGPYPPPQFSPGHFISPFQPPNYPQPGHDPAAMMHGAFAYGAQAPHGHPGFYGASNQASPSYSYVSPAQPGMLGAMPPADNNRYPPGAPPPEQSQARPDTERGWESPSKQNVPQRQAKHLDEEQVSFFAAEVKATWSNLSGIKDLSSSVRLHVAFREAVSSFRSRFEVDPDLDLCAEALSQHPALKNVKTVQGLSCKACRSKAKQQATPSTKDGAKLYNTMSLVSHFSQVHVADVSLSSSPSRQESDLQNLDWKEDMIDLPDRRRILELLKAPGMDEQKLGILSSHFPEILSSRLAESDQHNADSPARKEELINPEHGTEPKGTSTHSGRGTRPSSRGTDADSPHYYPGRGENEYDPRRPSLDYMPRRSAPVTVYRAVSPQPLDGGHRQVYYAPSPLYYVGDNVISKWGAADAYVTTKVQRDPYEEEYARMPHRPDYRELDGSWIEVSPRGYSPDHFSRADRYPYHRVNEYEYRRSPRRDPDQMPIEVEDDGRPPRHLIEGHPGSEGQQPPKPQENLSRNGTPPLPESEADKFLNSLLPSKEVEEYHRRVEERDREREDALRAKWEAEKRTGEGPDPRPIELHPYEPRPENGEGRSNLGSALVPQGSSPAGRSPYAEAEPQRSPGFKDGGGYRAVNGSYRRREVPYHRPSRYARYGAVIYRHDDPSYHGQRIPRANSRFSRYEEQRRRFHSDRLHSRSPPPSSRRESNAAAIDDGYPDNRSVEPPGPPILPSRPSQVSPRGEPMHYDDRERGRYSPDPYVRYRYAEPPPPTYIDKLGRAVQFVRAVPEPYGAPPSAGPPGGYPPQPSPRPRYVAAPAPAPRHPHHLADPVQIYPQYYEVVMPPSREPMPDYVYYDGPPPLPPPGEPPFEGPSGSAGRGHRRGASGGGPGGLPPPQQPLPPPPPPGVPPPVAGAGAVLDVEMGEGPAPRTP